MVSLLKERSYEVYIAPDLDHVLDALWYHGSAVGCIVVETTDADGVDELMHALEDWPDLEVLIAGPTGGFDQSGPRKHRYERDYSLQDISHWLAASLRRPLDGERFSR